MKRSGPATRAEGIIAVSPNVSRIWDHSTLEQYPCGDGEPMAEESGPRLEEEHEQKRIAQAERPRQIERAPESQRQRVEPD